MEWEDQALLRPLFLSASQPPHWAGTTRPAARGHRAEAGTCPRRPALNGHAGSSARQVVVSLPQGDVVAIPVDGAGAVAHRLGAGPAPFLAGAGRGRGLQGLQGPGLPSPAQRAARRLQRAPSSSYLQALLPAAPAKRAPCSPQSPCLRRPVPQSRLCGAPPEAGPGPSPGVAVTLTLVPGQVQVASGTHLGTPPPRSRPAVVNQLPRGTQPLTLCLVLGGGGERGSGPDARRRDGQPSSDAPQTPRSCSPPHPPVSARALSRPPEPHFQAPCEAGRQENGLPGAPEGRSLQGPAGSYPSRDQGMRGQRSCRPRPRIWSSRGRMGAPAPPPQRCPGTHVAGGQVWQLTGLGPGWTALSHCCSQH